MYLRRAAHWKAAFSRYMVNPESVGGIKPHILYVMYECITWETDGPVGPVTPTSVPGA